MSDRTYGATKNCAGCRFWSEMLAMAEGGGPVKAMCLNPKSSEHSRYTVRWIKCDAWQSGHHGAVDDPPNYGEETRALYAEEEGDRREDMSTTPRTDEWEQTEAPYADLLNLARQLERELALLPSIIRGSTWQNAELRESAAHLVETITSSGRPVKWHRSSQQNNHG